MSLPSFPKDPAPSSPSHHAPGSYESSSSGHQTGGGAGNLLPKSLLIVCGVCSAIATLVSMWSIYLQLKSYRRPLLQRSVVRIMLMVPLYAIASIIALFSLDAAFFIDTVRDLYEAFVIYTFFQLLVSYLGGERSLLILLHGRPPIPHPFPFNLFLSPMDISDPWVLLNLKRGILQYVQVKPLLVLATVILKVTNTYREGDFAFDSGYTYVSVIYNASICLSLYCLAMFWVCVSKDLKPFRPVPKFLCVKGILFFSFWQGLAVALLVAVRAIKRLGAYTDKEHMSLALTDSLVCIEMPLFAVAHQYAFQASDYIDENLQYCARMPFFYALRDAFGTRDVWEDSKHTLKGRGVSYQAYEPAEGGLHVGEGRMRRIRAGLRYSKGGTQKYWIQQPGDEDRIRHEGGPVKAVKRRVENRINEREAYAPLLPKQTARILHHPDSRPYDSDSDSSEAPSCDFEGAGPEDQWEEAMYSRAKKIEYIGYPNVDVSREEARRKLWEEEDGVLAGKWMRKAKDTGDRLLHRDQDGGSQNKNDPAKKKDKGKGKNGKGDKKRGVYGEWANGAPRTRYHSADSNTTSKQGRSTGPSPGDSPKKLSDVVIDSNGQDHEDWLYDGDVEQSGGWRPDDPNGNHLRVTRHRGSGRNSPASRRQPTPTRSPFAIGGDDDSSSSDSEGIPEIATGSLPSDAVDLVVDDRQAVEEAQKYERQKGDPNAHNIQHVYVRGDERHNGQHTVESKPGQTIHTTEQERHAAVHAGRQIEEADVVREVSPPPVLASLQDVDGNPWA